MHLIELPHFLNVKYEDASIENGVSSVAFSPYLRCTQTYSIPYTAVEVPNNIEQRFGKPNKWFQSCVICNPCLPFSMTQTDKSSYFAYFQHTFHAPTGSLRLRLVVCSCRNPSSSCCLINHQPSPTFTRMNSKNSTSHIKKKQDLVIVAGPIEKWPNNTKNVKLTKQQKQHKTPWN